MFCKLKFVQFIVLFMFVFTIQSSTGLKDKHKGIRKEAKNVQNRVNSKASINNAPWDNGNKPNTNTTGINYDTSKRQDIPEGGDQMTGEELQRYQFEDVNQRDENEGDDTDEVPLEGQNTIDPGFAGFSHDQLRLPEPYPFSATPAAELSSDDSPSPIQEEVVRKRNYFLPHPQPDYKVTHVHVFHPENPCKSGGVPVKSAFGYHCLCSREFHGRFCDEKLYCSSSPCQNGGTCEEMANNYRCRCQPGYVGYNCEERDFCLPNPCKNEGTCYETASSYKCLCRSGFTGASCEEIDYCDPNPCLNGGSCDQKHGAHACVCKPEYKGNTCQERKICFSNPCHNGGKCIEEDTQSPCICPQGYTHPFCKEHVCSSQPCKNRGKCSAKKEGNSWRFHCDCPFLFQGERCEIPNPCAGHPCMNGGSCIDTFSKYNGFPEDWDVGFLHYYCSCPMGFSGENCKENNCAHCHVNATCIHGRCVCDRGLHGNGFTCTELKNPCRPNPCLNNGTCSVGPDQSFDCECPTGFSPPLCQANPKPCDPNPCKNHGICVTGPEHHGYHCICPDKFLPPDCSQEITDPCSSYPCKNGGTCKATEDGKGFICICKTEDFTSPYCDCGCPKGSVHSNPPVFPASCGEDGGCYCRSIPGKKEFLYVTGKGCVEQRTNPCANSPCKNGGTCAATADGLSFTCRCPDDCTGEYCQNCDVSKICTANYCKNGGTCIVVEHKAHCLCPPEFLPPLCEKKHVTAGGRHVCHPNPCQNDGTCRRVGNGYECTCTSQYEGIHCGKDKCLKCDVHATCHNGRCKCRPGYLGSGYKGDCVKERYCESCPSNAFCRNKECACIDGFYLLNNECLKIPLPY